MGVTVLCCLLAMESKTFMSMERTVGTCWCMRVERSSMREDVIRSPRGVPSSSDVIRRKVRPRGVVSEFRTNCVYMCMCAFVCV